MRQPLPARGYAKIKLTADQAPGPQHRTTPPRVARLLADHSANPCRSAVPAPATDASASEANYAVASCLGRRLLTGVVGCHVGTLSRAWARASHPSLRRGRFLRPSCVDEVRAGEVRVGGSAQCALAPLGRVPVTAHWQAAYGRGREVWDGRCGHRRRGDYGVFGRWWFRGATAPRPRCPAACQCRAGHRRRLPGQAP